MPERIFYNPPPFTRWLLVFLGLGLSGLAMALLPNEVFRICGLMGAMWLAVALFVGAIIAFAAGLGEFGAVITFASNIPGETRTLPLALYTALQSPGGDALAARLAGISFVLGLTGLVLAEWVSRALRRRVGR